MFCFEWTDEHPSRCQFSDLLLKRLVLIDLSLIEEPTSAGTELASGIRQSERGSHAPGAGFDSLADAEAFAEAAWIIAPVRYAGAFRSGCETAVKAWAREESNQVVQ